MSVLYVMYVMYVMYVVYVMYVMYVMYAYHGEKLRCTSKGKVRCTSEGKVRCTSEWSSMHSYAFSPAFVILHPHSPVPGCVSSSPLHSLFLFNLFLIHDLYWLICLICRHPCICFCHSRWWGFHA